jgi:rhamnogalacturonyl hydrolase YesR
MAAGFIGIAAAAPQGPIRAPSAIESIEGAGAPESAPTLLLLGGLDGDPSSTRAVLDAVTRHRETRPGYRLIAVPQAGPVPGADTPEFPPSGIAYRENGTAHAIWRWTGLEAPDRVVVVGEDFGLAAALSTQPVAGIGRIPARAVEAGSLPDLIATLGTIAPSEARLEMERRRARAPQQVAEQLASVYGRSFDPVTYLPGMALIGRMRLGEIDEVRRLAEPYLAARPAIRSSLDIAGHLVFAELAERTGEAGYLALARSAADLGFDARGDMLEAMPFHNEMSDAYFMAAPILARTGRLTGETRYYDMAARHLGFMEDLVLRDDGLYRHSPLTDAAWGRGNAFPALGLALALSDFPESHPAFPGLLAAYRNLMAALLPHQDTDGLWHQVVDEPSSYAELSSTAMIATAMLRGIRRAWLDPAPYQAGVDRAWAAALTRTGSDGALIDVCESTNKQPTLEAYLNRAALLGPDERGGGMMLMFATEMAGME